jgi:anti-sigma B factor antagonist
MMDIKISAMEKNHILWIDIKEPEASIRISGRMHQLFEEYLVSGIKNIAVNLGEVDFIDSSFLGILVSAMKDADTKGIRIVLHSVRPNVKAIFDLTRLDKLIPILPDENAVYEHFRL